MAKQLTSKQAAALLEAYENSGRLFQLPERKKHSPATLAALVKAGLFTKEPVGVVWTLTDEGRTALQQVY